MTQPTGQLQKQLHLPQRLPKQLVLVVVVLYRGPYSAASCLPSSPSPPWPFSLPIQAILGIGIWNGLVRPAVAATAIIAIASASYPPFVVVGQQLIAPSKTLAGLVCSLMSLVGLVWCCCVPNGPE